MLTAKNPRRLCAAASLLAIACIDTPYFLFKLFCYWLDLTP